MAFDRLAIRVTVVAACVGATALAITAWPDAPAGYSRVPGAPDVPWIAVSDPLAAARIYAARYPDLIAHSDGPEYARFEASLPADERALARAAGQALLDAWVARQLAHATPALAGLAAADRVAQVRRAVRNQRQLRADSHTSPFLACQNDPAFELGAAARLLRGATNCEGQNHLLARLLAETHPATLTDLADSHTVVLLGDGGSAPSTSLWVADAWSDWAPFDAHTHGDRPARPVPTDAAHDEGTTVGPWSLYADGWRKLRPEPTATRRARSEALPGILTAALQALPPRAVPPDADVPAGFAAYLDARVLDLFGESPGDADAARRAYRSFLDAYCAPDGSHASPGSPQAPTYLCDAAAWFADAP